MLVLAKQNWGKVNFFHLLFLDWIEWKNRSLLCRSQWFFHWINVCCVIQFNLYMRRNSILMKRHYPDLGSASDWSCRLVNLIQPIRSATQIWVVALHQYRISTLVSQTSFGGETSGSVVKCWLFSQANKQPIQNTTIFLFNPFSSKVTNIYFLTTISINNQEKRLWELMK